MPRLLDLFCGQGGASMGYYRAGWDVVGVDNVDHSRRYPFRFVKANALIYLWLHWQDFDAIHASPPCQHYSIGTMPTNRDKHPDLIGPVRDALNETGKPWIIENVPRSPLVDPVLLCGTMFGLQATDTDGTRLRLERHRLFESNIPLHAPRPCHHDRTIPVAGVYGGGRQDRMEAKYIRRGGYTPHKAQREELMGIDWMSMKGLSQAIPPIYTEHLGGQLLDAVRAAA